MEFLVEFAITVPDGTPPSDVRERERAEAAAAEKLVREGHLLRVWTRNTPSGATTVLGLYRTDGRAELDRRLSGLPLYAWMKIAVTPLGPHPNDPANASAPARPLVEQLDGSAIDGEVVLERNRPASGERPDRVHADEP